MRLSSFYRLEAGVNGKTYPTKVKDSEDTKLRQLVEKHYRKMVRMEKAKYSTPRFSEALKDIASFLGCLNDPVKNDDELSREDSQGRDIATSDSHFSGFSRFSTSNRPSGFAMAPPPEGVTSPKRIGNAGSTISESPYRSSMLTNKGHNNAGAGQKADQKGGNDGGTNQATGKY